MLSQVSEDGDFHFHTVACVGDLSIAIQKKKVVLIGSIVARKGVGRAQSCWALSWDVDNLASPTMRIFSLETSSTIQMMLHIRNNAIGL